MKNSSTPLLAVSNGLLIVRERHHLFGIGDLNATALPPASKPRAGK